MSGNQPENLCREPIIMGIRIFAPISSEAGSATILFSQPIISGRIFASSAVLIGSELFLLIAQHLFCLESIPVLDAKNGQTVQMPLSELQEFLRWIINGSAPSSNPNPVSNRTNLIANQDGEITRTISTRGFLTPETPEAPLVVALYISADYSNRPFTPYVVFTGPILTFPGLRGALPLLILGLLATIFVRAVVPPELTGSKPLPKPETRKNSPLTFTSNDLIQLLTRFGKHFGSK